MREYLREYRIKNKDKIRAKHLEWRRKHPGHNKKWQQTPWECPHCGEVKTNNTRNYHLKNKCPGRRVAVAEEEPLPPPPTEEELREILMLYTPPPPPLEFCRRPCAFYEFSQWWNAQ